jgi:hypothetical protein
MGRRRKRDPLTGPFGGKGSQGRYCSRAFFQSAPDTARPLPSLGSTAICTIAEQPVHSRQQPAGDLEVTPRSPFCRKLVLACQRHPIIGRPWIYMLRLEVTDVFEHHKVAARAQHPGHGMHGRTLPVIRQMLDDRDRVHQVEGIVGQRRHRNVAAHEMSRAQFSRQHPQRVHRYIHADNLRAQGRIHSRPTSSPAAEIKHAQAGPVGELHTQIAQRPRHRLAVSIVNSPISPIAPTRIYDRRQTVTIVPQGAKVDLAIVFPELIRRPFLRRPIFNVRHFKAPKVWMPHSRAAQIV